MPTYEYVCKSCSHKFDEFHGMNESPKIACPSCGSKKTERLISAGAGLIFKGSGFYITDYKKSNGSGSKNNGASKDPSKTETKPESSTSSGESKSESNSKTDP
jgi:putative FmdB family regulatory protein